MLVSSSYITRVLIRQGAKYDWSWNLPGRCFCEVPLRPYHVFLLILVDALAALLLLGLFPQRLRDLLDGEVGVAALHELLQGVIDELVLVLQDARRGRVCSRGRPG